MTYCKKLLTAVAWSNADRVQYRLTSSKHIVLGGKKISSWMKRCILKYYIPVAVTRAGKV